jgi:hypothetical protein
MVFSTGLYLIELVAKRIPWELTTQDIGKAIGYLPQTDGKAALLKVKPIQLIEH